MNLTPPDGSSVDLLDSEAEKTTFKVDAHEVHQEAKILLAELERKVQAKKTTTSQVNAAVANAAAATNTTKILPVVFWLSSDASGETYFA